MNEHFLTNIGIKQFKCFSDFQAKGFKRVNLIGGKNNIGKTAFMEACYINVYSKNIDSLISAIISIKFSRENANLVLESEIKRQYFLDYTKNYQANSNLHTINFSILEGEGIKEYLFNIDEKSKTINAQELTIITYFISNILFIDNFGFSNDNLNEAYKKIQFLDKEQELNEYIKEFDSNIENLKIIGDEPQCKVQGEYRDITEFGDGLKHYVSIICALFQCENGYLFIDEIDNGIHYSQLDRLWEIILTLSKQNNCQIFVTTHSKEMIDSFARVSEKMNEQDISYTTIIKNRESRLKAITRSYDGLLGSLEDEHEVRGR